MNDSIFWRQNQYRNVLLLPYYYLNQQKAFVGGGQPVVLYHSLGFKTAAIKKIHIYRYTFVEFTTISHAEVSSSYQLSTLPISISLCAPPIYVYDIEG